VELEEAGEHAVPPAEYPLTPTWRDATMLAMSDPTPNAPIAQAMTRTTLVTALAVINAVVGQGLLWVGGWMVVRGLIDYASLAIALGGLLLALAGLAVACTCGLWRLRGWGRRLQLLLAVLALPLFPVGTAVGLVVVLYLAKPGARALFSGRTAEELEPSEREALAALRGLSWRAQLQPWPVQAVVLVTFALGVTLAAINIQAMRQRTREKLTRRSLMYLAAAVEAYRVDSEQYPAADSLDSLASLLEPDYVATAPRLDAWGHPLRFEAWGSSGDPGSPDSYAIGSPGRDGRWEAARLRDLQATLRVSFDQDLVWANGTWVELVDHPEDW